MDKQLFRLNDSQKARSVVIESVLNAPSGHMVTIAPANRTTDQNSYQWPILTAFSDQLEWPINGSMQKISPEDWKDILTAAFKRESVRVAMAIDGTGFVMLGQRTSKFNKKKFSEWIEFLHMVAADRGVDIECEELKWL